jgi:hypothetical protein
MMYHVARQLSSCPVTLPLCPIEVPIRSIDIPFSRSSYVLVNNIQYWSFCLVWMLGLTERRFVSIDANDHRVCGPPPLQVPGSESMTYSAQPPPVQMLESSRECTNLQVPEPSTILTYLVGGIQGQQLRRERSLERLRPFEDPPATVYLTIHPALLQHC